ncbi:MAG: zinc ribbon domain-containing protein [Gammaproteobacteria bacterium]|nr:zinc ribbon domain-containing protein [Gammaproteobacteria bacterium]MYH16798.1 zinc ribbon domain-containing protein [Gammaproteobacteria bacterium]MYK81729.1 zinc ribbon domain-containing protein [Gammaproteobacteria bacterium]
MPLYGFRCTDCGTAHEELRPFAERDQSACCRSCGGVAKRVPVSGFRVAGAKPKTADASLASTGADFLSSPDRFVTAMDTFGDKVGARLTAAEKERAVSRLEEAAK